MSGARDALPHQLEHLGADELGLRALAAGLEQPHGAVRRAPVGRRLEQRALEVVQRAAGARGVVLGALRQVDHLGGDRPQLLDRRGAAGERDAARLVGQREADVGLGVPAQRLDGVALRRREVVESVQEHRAPRPDRRVGAQRIERRPGVALERRAAELLERAAVGRVERAELAGVRRARAVGRPGAQRRGEPRRLDAAALELGEQPPRGVGEPGRAGGRGQLPQRDAGDRRADDAVARGPPERPRAQLRAARDLADQAREGEHLRAEDDVRARELALVVGDVGRGGHHQQRVARARGAQALEDGADLGGVGGPGDERQRHGLPGWRAWRTVSVVPGRTSGIEGKDGVPQEWRTSRSGPARAVARRCPRIRWITSISRADPPRDRRCAPHSRRTSSGGGERARCRRSAPADDRPVRSSPQCPKFVPAPRPQKTSALCADS